ncbi:PREDICTED: G-protein coupled receptor moody-like [Branchiostoma belcheri]|uniref:G-protein coupled receptor moody-like n=1 Tax=Branchiostoma belcheri TaxID=7741 RepID=A0A6P5A3W3_BRABE|nr:PREDICTED: G-protein coupled receptor moody-like [Branchiostoma belcheri]
MAVSTALLYTFIVLMAAIIAVSIIGNLLVILAVFLCPSLRKRDNIPLASLSVSDLLFTALHPPMWIVALLKPEFRLPWGLCVLQSYTTPVLWGVCLCHMGCIAVYRFFRVLYRYRFPAMISTKAICIKVTLAWLVPFLSFILIHLNPARDVKYDDKIKHCAVVQTSSTLAKAIAGLPVICPYFVALACYIAIWLSLRKSKKTMLGHNLLEAPKHKVAAPKSRIKTSSVPQEGSTSHRVSIVLEEEGSLRIGSMVVTPSSRDDIENLPGVPEHSAIIKTKCSWTKTQQDSGEPSEADQPQTSAAPSAEDNITNISLPASTIGGDKIQSSIPSLPPEGGKRAVKESLSPSRRQLVLEPESSGKKARKKIGRRRAYIHEEGDSDLTTTDSNLPNTTVHDLSTTVSVSRSSFNRAEGNIAGRRKKPRRLHLSPAEKEMLKMMVAVFINYALCNLPMTVMALAENGDRVPEEAFLVGMLLWAGNGAMNPIIYGFMNTRFKQGYRDIWNRFTRLFR